VREEPDAVEIVVADDDPGIPEEEIEILERGEETGLEHTSGLGLWLVHWIVTESGGSVAFESSDTGGSVVRLRLPTEPRYPGAEPPGTSLDPAA
jgi:signal transduction histidine kinase